MKYIVTFYIEEQRLEKACSSWKEVLQTLKENSLPDLDSEINIRAEY